MVLKAFRMFCCTGAAASTNVVTNPTLLKPQQAQDVLVFKDDVLKADQPHVESSSHSKEIEIVFADETETKTKTESTAPASSFGGEDEELLECEHDVEVAIDHVSHIFQNIAGDDVTSDSTESSELNAPLRKILSQNSESSVESLTSMLNKRVQMMYEEGRDNLRSRRTSESPVPEPTPLEKPWQLTWHTNVDSLVGFERIMFLYESGVVKLRRRNNIDKPFECTVVDAEGRFQSRGRRFSMPIDLHLHDLEFAASTVDKKRRFTESCACIHHDVFEAESDEEDSSIFIPHDFFENY